MNKCIFTCIHAIQNKKLAEEDEEEEKAKEALLINTTFLHMIKDIFSDFRIFWYWYTLVKKRRYLLLRNTKILENWKP